MHKIPEKTEKYSNIHKKYPIYDEEYPSYAHKNTVPKQETMNKS